MKRVGQLVLVAYVGLAVLGHLKEREGSLRCDCADDCWCKRAPLRLFRWVFPAWHRAQTG